MEGMLGCSGAGHGISPPKGIGQTKHHNTRVSSASDASHCCPNQLPAPAGNSTGGGRLSSRKERIRLLQSSPQSVPPPAGLPASWVHLSSKGSNPFFTAMQVNDRAGFSPLKCNCSTKPINTKSINICVTFIVRCNKALCGCQPIWQ